MYTHETFVTDGLFTLMRPIYFTMLILAILLFLMIISRRLRERLLNLFNVVSLSLILGIITVQVTYYDAIIVDEIGLGGDPTTFFRFDHFSFKFAQSDVIFLAKLKNSKKLNRFYSLVQLFYMK
jgi:energy-coupling factor transporter transmembrane protein EcfT